MKKKLDLIHYVLIALLLGTVFFYNSPLIKSSNNSDNSEAYDILLEKSKEDSLVTAEQYNQLLVRYNELNGLYQDLINVKERTTLINEKQNKEKPVSEIREDRENSKKYTTEKDHDEVKSESNERQITNTVKGVLQFKNFDGAEIDYIGEVIDNKAHGYGFAVFEKKGFYKGEWENNRQSGEGIYYWQNGDVYEGQYADGLRTGYGVYTFATGEVYQGYWKENLRHGEGILYDKKGKVISNGPWTEDKPSNKNKKKN